MNFKNLMLLIENSCQKYEANNLFAVINEGDKIFKIFEKKEENYIDFYSTTIKTLKEYNPSDLTPNFKYYFTSPKKACKMKFSFNFFRKKAIIPVFNLTTNKIHSIFGPY